MSQRATDLNWYFENTKGTKNVIIWIKLAEDSVKLRVIVTEVMTYRMS